MRSVCCLLMVGMVLATPSSPAIRPATVAPVAAMAATLTPEQSGRHGRRSRRSPAPIAMMVIAPSLWAQTDCKQVGNRMLC